MKKIFIIALFLMASCAPRGVVVYQNVDGNWKAKEIHVLLDSITTDSVERVAGRLNSCVAP